MSLIIHKVHSAKKELRDTETEERLSSYASGNGAISFSWARLENDRWISTGRKVLEEEALKYVKGCQPHLQHWKLINVYGNLSLFHPVFRLNENTILVDQVPYTYSKASEQHFFIKNEDGDEVRNLNIVGAIMFFVNNEKHIEEQSK